jgi:hypothetical protein
MSMSKKNSDFFFVFKKGDFQQRASTDEAGREGKISKANGRAIRRCGIIPAGGIAQRFGESFYSARQSQGCQILSCHSIPKHEKMYQVTTNYTKWP